MADQLRCDSNFKHDFHGWTEPGDGVDGKLWHVCPGTPSEIVHQRPHSGVGLTPCCRKTIFEIPSTDRVTFNPSIVTCKGLEL